MPTKPIGAPQRLRISSVRVDRDIIRRRLDVKSRKSSNL